MKSRVICLTDGAVNNRDTAINLAQHETITFHTIGIGSGCDKFMLEKMAEKGKGSCSIIADNEGESALNAKVITALGKALEPALEHCSLIWGA